MPVTLTHTSAPAVPHREGAERNNAAGTERDGVKGPGQNDAGGPARNGGAPAGAAWSRGHLVAFRFAFIYLILYTFPLPFTALPFSRPLADAVQASGRAVIP